MFPVGGLQTHTHTLDTLQSPRLFPVSVCLSSSALTPCHLPSSMICLAAFIFSLFSYFLFSVHPFFLFVYFSFPSTPTTPPPSPCSSCLLSSVLFLQIYSSQTSHCTWLKATCFSSLPTAGRLYHYISSPLAHIRK